MRLRTILNSLGMAGVGIFLLTLSAQAVVNPFTEDFATNASNWRNGRNTAATWLATGGVSDGGYITAAGTIDTNGFGPIVFRGNNGADASGDAFVGNWLAGGVTLFTAYVRHDAPTNLSFYVRLDAGTGNAASTTPQQVAPNAWTQLVIPITNSLGTNGQVFQSYGAAGTNFGLIFSNIQSVQVALAANQDPITVGQTYTIGLDQVSVVPEPGVSALLLGSVAALAGFHFFRRRQS